MRGLPDKLQYAPRQGATHSPNLDVLVPALMKLRHCNDSLSTLILIEGLPDRILPDLAWYAAEKTYIPRVAIKTLIKACGPAYLERCLGRERARILRERFPTSASFERL